VARIERSLKAWQHVQESVEGSINENMSEAHAQCLVRLGKRITHIQAGLR
jgi:hypothetical protein